MGNTIKSITAEEGLTVQQTDQWFSLYLNDKAPNTLELTRKTNIIPPPLPIMLSKRTLLVKNLILKLNNATLLHIQGEIGTGKTQLCNLIINNIESDIYWFRIREYKVQLKVFMTELNNIINNSQNFKLFSKALKIKAASILVLDDLPNLAEYNIVEDFIQLVMTCEKHNIKIISSSNYPLLDRIKQYSRFIESEYISVLTKDETLEILDSYDAPSTIKKLVKLINLFSDSHPSLVIATINYLKSNNWKIDFDDLFKNKFIENDVQNAQDFLDKTVSDSQTKELVYRLNSIGRTITEEEIKLVSSIEPKIEHPFVKFRTLLHIWIFNEGDGEYFLSPLLYKTGSKNLDLTVEKNVNLALADNLFKKTKVNPYEISKCINYYIKAKEFNSAGFSLFQALHSAIKTDSITEDNMFYLHSYWLDTNMPEEININTQILIRTAQIILNHNFGNDIEKLYENYLMLESKIFADDSKSSTLLMSYMLFSQKNYRGFEYNLKFTELMSNYTEEDKKQLGIPFEVEDISVDTIFLLSFDKLDSLDVFKQWVMAIKKVDAKKLKSLFKSKLGIESILPLMHVIKTKLIPVATTLQLKELYILLIDLSKYMYSHSIINSWASLISSAVNCLIKEEKLDEAYNIVNEALLTTDSDDAKLIICHYLAMKYADEKEYNNALNLYIHVVDINETLYNDLLVDALTFSSIAFSLTGKSKNAKVYIEKALSVYKDTKNYDELLLAKLYGEYSIILWNLNLEYEYLLACEKVLFLIEKNSDEINNNWKATELILGHCLGYCFSMLSLGKPPKSIENGEVYIKPDSRFFIYSSNKSHTLYDINKRFILYYQLYDSFYQLNDKVKGIVYLHKSFELSEYSPLEEYKTLLYKDTYLVENNFIEYFKFIKSLSGKIGQDTILVFLHFSLLKLIIELNNSRNKIKEYKIAFIDSFSEVLEEKFFNVIIHTLDTLNGEESVVEFENHWMTQRIYFLSKIQNLSFLEALKIHEIFYDDFFGPKAQNNTNIIKIEVIENYFFTFWISSINTCKNSFSYSDILLDKLTENQQKRGNSKDKVLTLLKLIKGYIKQ